jgi:glycosyltransferase involved in cell wall biosynthesis
MACRFLIFEEQLYDGKSHHLAYYDSILSAAEKSGNKAILYANTEAEEFVCQRLNAIPAMWTMAGLAASGQRQVRNKFRRALMMAKHLFKNFLVCTFAVKRHRPDAVLCLSTWIPHLLLFLLVALWLGRSMPKLVLLFVWYPRIGKAKLLSFRLVRIILRWLLKVHPRTYVFAETRYARRAWEEFLGVPVSYAVHPVEVAEREEKKFESGNAEKLKQGGTMESAAHRTTGRQDNGQQDGTTKDTNTHERGGAGLCLDKPSGAAFSNPFTSELARDSENTPLTRSARGPAMAAEPPRTDHEGRRAEENAEKLKAETLKTLDSGRSALDSPAKPVVVVVAPGLARYEKGSDIFQEAIKLILRAEERVTSVEDKAECGNTDPGGIGFAFHGARKLKDKLTTKHNNLHEKGEEVLTTDNTDGHGYQKTQQGEAQGTCAGASESDSLASELADSPVSKSLIRSADAPASLPATSHSLLATAPAALALDAGRSTLDAPAKPVVFGFYGFARHEQGVDVLMRALEILKDKGELNAEFRIVWSTAFQMPDGSWMDRNMFAHLGPNVRFCARPLLPDEFLEALAETDWLVLPYRVSSYEGRCSRISVEACVLGIPAIYTEGTDLEDVISRHGAGFGVPPENAEELSHAILKAEKLVEIFKRKSLAQRTGARRNFSGKFFLNEILSALCLNNEKNS